MLLLLALACDDTGLDPAAAEDSAGDRADTGHLAGDWDDPILGGVSIELDVSHPELTDALMAGDQLAFVGQEQGTDGGMWTYSLANPDAPVLLGHTTDRKHIQKACWDGTQAWGITREGMLSTLELTESGPVVLQETGVSMLGTGIDCNSERVVWGEGVTEGGWAERQGTWIGPMQPIKLEVMDVLLEGDRLWVLANDRLTALDFEGDQLVELGSVELDGACLDLAPGIDWIAVACGSGGVSLVDRGDGQPSRLGGWSGFAAARTVSVQGQHVWVAAWTDALVLDATDPAAPQLIGVEPAVSSVMSVVAGEGERAYVADWNSPFVATRTGASAPEVRLSSKWVAAGASASVYNDGTELLWLDGRAVAPGESWSWEIPEDAQGTVNLPTDDPDEPLLTVDVGGPDGLLVGEEAPGFAEPDLYGETWNLALLHGEVVFLGLFTEG